MLAFSGCGSNVTGSSAPPAGHATPRSYAAAQPVFELRSYLNYDCLDIKGANTANGAQVIMWGCHGGANQRWYWDGDRIRSLLNNKCLDVKGADPSNGAQVIMWSCHGDANQRWYWDGEQIRSWLNHKCLDIKGANPADGAQVIMWDCHGGANQRWYQLWY